MKSVCKSQIVYILESDEGIATSSSNDFEDENGEPIEILCFWSVKAYAKACQKEGWNNYSIEEVSLSDFLENWCVGISNDELLVGTNFDANMFGFEAEPLELILEILEELKSNKIELEFNKYQSHSDFENQVREIL